MSFINPQSWKFYTGSFLTNEAAGISDFATLQVLRNNTKDACTAGASFDPARCARLSQMLGRLETKAILFTGAPITPTFVWNKPADGTVLAAAVPASTAAVVSSAVVSSAVKSLPNQSTVICNNTS